MSESILALEETDKPFWKGQVWCICTC